MRKPLGIQKCDRRTDGRTDEPTDLPTDRPGKVQSCVSATKNDTKLKKAYWVVSYGEFYEAHSPNRAKTHIKIQSSMKIKYLTSGQ